MTLLQSGITKSLAEAYTIDQSLRISNEIDSYLSKQYSEAGNQRTWTISVWVKRAKLDDTNQQHLLNYSQGTSYPRGGLKFYPNSYAPEESLLISFNGMATAAILSSSAMYVDPASWYHVVCGCDTTLSDSSNRYILYVNGERLTSFSGELQPNQNDDTAFGQTGDYHLIGRWSPSMYIAEYHFLDGIQAAASDFGETNSTTNQWVPIEYEGSYGTNGFYQKYSSTVLANSFDDSSSSDHTITANGDITNTQAVKKIGDSAIRFDGTGDYLSIPDSTDWDLGTGEFTLECWAYWSVVGNAGLIPKLDGTGGSKSWQLSWFTPLGLYFYGNGDGGTSADSFYKTFTPVVDTWYHIAAVRVSNTTTLYVDGSSIGSSTTDWNNDAGTSDLLIGREDNTGSTNDLNGYMDEIRISNTARYTGNFTPSTTAFTSDANTKLLIHSNWTGGLGTDSSGNGNTYTVTNLVATDQTKDSPTNNFCTLNPLNTVNAPTISEGNLKTAETTGNEQEHVRGTIAAATGKWYFEGYITGTGAHQEIALDNYTADMPTHNGTLVNWLYQSEGSLYDGTATVSTDVASYTAGDVLQIAWDMDASKVWFGKNNTWQGAGSPNPATATAPNFSNLSATIIPRFGNYQASTTWTANFGQDSSFAGVLTAQGNQDGNEIGDFYYAPPAGFLALCTSNLPTPEIADPTDHFNTVLYTGDASTRSITDVGFQSDLIWGKSRDSTNAHVWTDSVRGTDSQISSQRNNAEDTQTDVVTSFDTHGFSVGASVGFDMNQSGSTLAVWNWKGDGVAGGTLNEVGSIDSQVNVNTTAGFSIASYTGDGGVSATIGHGLSQAPELVIVKNRDAAENWAVGSSKGMDFTDYMILNTATYFADDVEIWNDTAPTATVFTIGTSDLVNDTDDYIAYCFHSIEGYSKIGSYVGNGDADGAFIYTGFSPAYILIKEITPSNDGWFIVGNKRNTYNLVNKSLEADSNAVEKTSTEVDLDMVSNGFKYRASDNGNGSGSTYLFMAFAETPFKTANAR